MTMSERPNRFQRDIDHWNRTGKCLRHFALDTPPVFCEQCGKDWAAVMDGREGRKRRRAAAPPSEKVGLRAPHEPHSTARHQ